MTKLLFGTSIFLATMAAAWALGLLGLGDRRLPDDHAKPQKCMLWFVGSSSIYRWTTLGQDMAPWVAHNRGISGATFHDITPRFSDVAASEGRPVAIILYAGENDIATGEYPRSVLRDLARFSAARNQRLKDVPLFVLSMKPSPGRAHYFKQQQLYNRATRLLLPTLHDTHYVDITTPLLRDGMPQAHYQDDGIHMTPSGYAIWASVVRKSLSKTLPPSLLRQCGVTD